MALEIRILLDDDQERMLNAVAKSSVGNKTYVKHKLFSEGLTRAYNRLPQSVLDNLKVKGDDEANA
jgi:hypothetical protein